LEALTRSGDCLTVRLLPDAHGVATVTATDPEGLRTTATTTLTVRPVNDAPVWLDPGPLRTPRGIPVVPAQRGRRRWRRGEHRRAALDPAFASASVIAQALLIAPVGLASGRAAVGLRLTDAAGATTAAAVDVGALPPQPSCFHYRAQQRAVRAGSGDGLSPPRAGQRGL